jgi:hypothetical protein
VEDRTSRIDMLGVIQGLIEDSDDGEKQLKVHTEIDELLESGNKSDFKYTNKY